MYILGEILMFFKELCSMCLWDILGEIGTFLWIFSVGVGNPVGNKNPLDGDNPRIIKLKGKIF
jgi:hypothetical protein